MLLGSGLPHDPVPRTAPPGALLHGYTIYDWRTPARRGGAASFLCPGRVGGFRRRIERGSDSSEARSATPRKPPAGPSCLQQLGQEQRREESLFSSWSFELLALPLSSHCHSPLATCHCLPAHCSLLTLLPLKLSALGAGRCLPPSGYQPPPCILPLPRPCPRLWPGPSWTSCLRARSAICSRFAARESLSS
jgi:hypothetical protein